MIGILLGLFAAFSTREQEKDTQPQVTTLDLTMLGLTSIRTGRLTAYDNVTEPSRQPFTETKPDRYGTSQTTIAERSGVRKALGSLIACPTCIATRAAALRVNGLRIAPGPTWPFLAFTSAGGLAELLNSATEALSWSGCVERKQAGRHPGRR